MTNGERIRAMTDEEMAQFFCRTIKVECWRCPAKDLCYTDHNGFLDWLKLPAELEVRATLLPEAKENENG